MKKTYAVLIAACAFVIGLGINTTAISDIGSQKVAVADIQKIVSTSPAVKDLKKENEAKAKELQSWLKTAKTTIEKAKTQSEKEKLTKKYDAELKKKQEANKAAYVAKIAAIEKNINATIAAQAKASGYDLVLSKSVVLYGADDITDEVANAVK